MKSARLMVLSVFSIFVVTAVVLSPMLGAQGSDPQPIINPQDMFSIQKTVSPNIVSNGDTVTFTIRVQNKGYFPADLKVTDLIGQSNGMLAGESGGQLIYVSSSQDVTGIDSSYVLDAIDSASGVTLRNVGAGRTVVITYRAVVSDTRLDQTSFSSVRNSSKLTTEVLTTAKTALAGLRIIGSNLKDKAQACSSPVVGSFPDPSSTAELRCYSNNLVDRGVISGPQPQSKDVAPALALEAQKCTDSAMRDFTDVSASNSMQCAISLVHDLGIMGGYTDRTFRPQNGITRAEFIQSVLIAAKVPVTAAKTANNPFKDVSNIYALRDYIVAASQKGIVSGYSDGTFHPYSLIHRDEAAKIVLRAFGLSTFDTIPVRFADVQATDALAAYVYTAANLGAVTGANGHFYPKSAVSRSEVAQILSRMLGYLAGSNRVDAS